MRTPRSASRIAHCPNVEHEAFDIYVVVEYRAEANDFRKLFRQEPLRCFQDTRKVGLRKPFVQEKRVRHCVLAFPS